MRGLFSLVAVCIAIIVGSASAATATATGKRRLALVDTSTFDPSNLAVPERFKNMEWALAVKSELAFLVDFGNFRATFMDTLVAKSIIENCAACEAEYFGSSNPASDRDITIRGPRPDLVIAAFNQEFEQIWGAGKTSTVVFDGNLYGFNYLDDSKYFQTRSPCLVDVAGLDGKIEVSVGCTECQAYYDQRNLMHAQALAKLILKTRYLGIVRYGPALAFNSSFYQPCVDNADEGCKVTNDFVAAIRSKIESNEEGDQINRFNADLAMAELIEKDVLQAIDLKNDAYAIALGELFSSLNDASFTNCSALFQAYTTAGRNAIDGLWTKGGLNHVLNQIQVGLGNSLPVNKDEYLDSFIENLAGLVEDVKIALAEGQSTDLMVVEMSKHLSRAVQAAYRVLLDNPASERKKALEEDLLCLQSPAETLRKRARGKGNTRENRFTTARYLGEIDECVVKTLALDESQGQVEVQIQDHGKFLETLAANVIGYYYSTDVEMCFPCTEKPLEVSKGPIFECPKLSEDPGQKPKNVAERASPALLLLAAVTVSVTVATT